MTIKHVLVVDDSKSARLVLRKMLQSMDISVDMAASGEEALDYLASRRPDAIFMDHTMPGMDGLQTTRIIKENPDTAAIPIAMYTSKEGNGYGEGAKAYGVVGILPKPATANTLSAVVKQLAAAKVATAPAPARAAAPAAPPAAKAPPSASIEVIEDIARTTAEALLQSAIQQQILPLLEERFTRLRNEILISVEANTLDLARKVFDSGFDEFSTRLGQRLEKTVAELRAEQTVVHPLAPELVEQLRAQLQAELGGQIGTLARQIAEQTAAQVAEQAARAVFDARAGELSSRLAQSLGARLAELKASLRAPDKLAPEALQEIRAMVHSVATDKAQESAREASQRTAGEVAGQIMQDVNTSTRSVIKRMYVLAVLILVFGLVTAGAVVYSLKL